RLVHGALGPSGSGLLGSALEDSVARGGPRVPGPRRALRRGRGRPRATAAILASRLFLEVVWDPDGRTPMNVGLIGLGRMGRGIAESLIRGGFEVIVLNRTAERTRELAPPKARVAGSIAEVCRAGVVLTMVSDDRAVESIVFGESGLLASLPRGG